MELSLNLRLLFALVGSCTRSMRVQRTLTQRSESTRTQRGWLIVALLFLLAGCSSAPQIAFQNISHRQIYSLNLEDLEKLQFYISRDVVAQYQDATGTKSLLLARLTPGVATGAGPNWIKVSFREGGVDVPFITDPNQYDGRYWIATEVEGSKDFKRISELPDRSFLYKGLRYKVASGDDAILLFDWEGWKKLVETRKVTQGRQVGDNR
jgi:hypothetical protein